MKKSNKQDKRQAENLLPWLIPIALIIVWQVAVDAKWIDATYVPSPLAVLEQGVTLWQAGTLQQNMGISL